MEDPERWASRHQRALFELLDEFFIRATGSDVHRFATFDSFGDAVRSRASDLAPRFENAFQWADQELRRFYVEQGMGAFQAAKRLGELKLAVGGSSRFKQAQLDSVTSSLLYADTVLIPDPVLPWLESPRDEERFRHVLMLEAVFAILHLRPLVDADLPYPAIIVFPSWEKSLEERDQQTKTNLDRLLTDFIAHFLNHSLQTIDDIVAYARADPDRFLRGVEEHNLFVAPDGPIGEPIQAALKRYRQVAATWRTDQWTELYRDLPDEAKVINGIIERLAPQYHMLENADEMNSCPLLSVEQQAHYFRLISKMNSSRLVQLEVLDPRRQALIDGFAAKRLRWLSRLPIKSLIQLRRNNENSQFRSKLENVVNA